MDPNTNGSNPTGQPTDNNPLNNFDFTQAAPIHQPHTVITPSNQAAPVQPQAPITIPQPQSTTPAPVQPQPIIQPQPVAGAPHVAPVAPMSPVAPVNPIAPVAPVVQNNSGFGGPVAPIAGMSQPKAPSPKKRIRISKKLAAISASLIIILIGGSAFAYVGVILPNKPANVLKDALINSIKSNQATTAGFFNIEQGTTNIRFNYTSSYSSVNKNEFDFTLSPDISSTGSDPSLAALSAIKFKLDVRLVDGNFYFTPGDLSSIASLVTEADPSLAPEAQTIAGQFSNKWIEVNNSVTGKGTLGCVLNTKFALNSMDIKSLEADYAKNPFIIIKSTSKDVVNGQSSEKFVLSANKTYAKSFGNDSALNQLSIVKNIQKCDPSSSTSNTGSSSSSSSSDNATYNFSLSVNKSTKQIDQIDVTGTDSGTQLEVQSNISYGPVNITAPSASNTIQYTEALADLEQDYSTFAPQISSSLPSLQSLVQQFEQGVQQQVQQSTGSNATFSL